MSHVNATPGSVGSTANAADQELPGGRGGKALIVALTLGAWLLLLPSSSHFSLFELAVAGCGVAVLCLTVVARSHIRGAWSFPFITLLVLVVFHLGSLPEFLYSGESALPYVERFIHERQAATAAWLSMCGVLAFTLGSLLVGRSKPAPQVDPKKLGRRDALTRTLSDIASLLAMLALLAWFAFALRTGLGFGSGYDDYLRARQQAPLQLIYYALSVGLVFAALSYRRPLARMAFVLFGAFVVFGFPLGLRGEILFPLAAVASVVAVQRQMPKARTLFVIAALLLFPIGIVSDTRQGAELATYDVAGAPGRALSEMGASLAVVSATVEWHDLNGEAYYEGATYLAPVNDAFERYLLRRKPTPESQNMNHMSTQISTRKGNIGGSVIAEAYNNFAVLGMLVLLFMWGWVIAKLNMFAATGGLRLASAGLLSLIFLMLVRNSFASTPTLILMAGFLMVAAWFFSSGSLRDGTDVKKG